MTKDEQQQKPPKQGRQKSQVIVQQQDDTASTDRKHWSDRDEEFATVAEAETWIRREGVKTVRYRVALVRKPVTVAIVPKEVRKLTPVA